MHSRLIVVLEFQGKMRGFRIKLVFARHKWTLFLLRIALCNPVLFPRIRLLRSMQGTVSGQMQNCVWSTKEYLHQVCQFVVPDLDQLDKESVWECVGCIGKMVMPNSPGADNRSDWGVFAEIPKCAQINAMEYRLYALSESDALVYWFVSLNALNDISWTIWKETKFQNWYPGNHQAA